MDEPRFLTLEQVAEELNTSAAQIYALVRRGEIKAIRLGGRGQWRVERARLEEFIAELYADTATYVRENPLGEIGTSAESSDSANGAKLG